MIDRLKNLRTLSLLIALNIIASCGYQFQGAGTILPEDVRNIKIERVENNTTYPGVDVKFTEALKSQFERYGVVHVVEDENAADAILTTKVVSINNTALNVTSQTDISIAQEMQMVVSSTLKRRTGQTLWKAPRLLLSEPFADTGSSVVTTSSGFAQGGISGQTLSGIGNSQVSRGQEIQAIDRLIEEGTRQIYLDSVSENF